MFWSEIFDHELRYLAFDENASSVLLSELKDQPQQLIVNGEDPFWSHGTLCSAVSHIDAAGTAEALVARGFEVTTWMGIHDGRLYITDRESLYRLDL
jgi:hypothetical protein